MKSAGRTMNKHWMTLAGLACPGLVQAHEGHGLPGLSHWHADDAALLLVAVVAAAAGWWLARRK
jgi:hypothetical protein